jgi:hyperosmotically inducible protein
MIRTLLRVVLLVIIVAAAAAFFFGYRIANIGESEPARAVGTAGSPVDVDVDVNEARETGAEIGAKVAEGANEAQRFAAEAAVTAKIKSKMALDDNIAAARIDVDTNGTVVTLRGTVESADERERALRLARETEGVTSVVDQLSVR